ncbi:kinesin motor domain protein (macronuclear) [Tetrahymena thermophila SB210]|uniref:Kinesin motor domain protein n=1 Tax=Tetrahymena thermophila (strain SB210) TaxID=312017 RepID=W7XK53_TETTS|nr:kinesin motor domain protein [Tetrahymena thermophila SB210]EWS76231.1 kinesin motor domain protein [Tetrahymena thermophila SB210]|eukprot:XP_012651278.1 kinesin motor domain protein [Tetrahymena thermophila SB210]
MRLKFNQLLILLLIIFITAKGNNKSSQQAKIKKEYYPQLQKEGDNADVFRIIGSYDLNRLDPFLMLDYFKVRLPSGFPDHPHRGFETVTYMLSGQMHHEDFRGNKGILEKGDVQWMTAGKGIVHSEMPGSYDEDSIGFQLWINLKSSDKMIEPKYQEYKSNKFPLYQKDGLKVKVISGNYENVHGIINTNISVKFLDIQYEESNILFKEYIQPNHNCLIFIYQGKIKINDKIYDENAAIIFENYHEERYFEIFSQEKFSKFILLSGRPINEQVFNYGPFVLDSQATLRQAFEDYQLSKNGFEGANNWASQIKDFPQTKKKLVISDL